MKSATKLREERERLREQDRKLEAIEKVEMKEQGSSALTQLVYRNSTLITCLSTSFILFTGLVAVNEPSMVWLPLLLGVLAVLVTVLLSTARSVIKGTLSIIYLSIVSSFAYSLGYYFSYFDRAYGVYFLAVLSVYFLGLTVSYFKPRARSRWGALNLSLTVAFLTSLVIGTTFLSGAIAALAHFLAFILVFYLYYYAFSKGGLNGRKRQPTVIADERAVLELLRQAKALGHKAAFFSKGSRNSHQGSFLAIKGDYAYNLVPLYLEEAFKVSAYGRKGLALTYKGRVIDDFLIDLFYRFSPSSRTAGADFSLVLLDLKNQNGRKARLISTPLPDSKKKIISLVLPARSLTEEYSPEDSDIFSELTEDIENLSVALSEKQRQAVERLIQTGDRIEVLEKGLLEGAEITSEITD